MALQDITPEDRDVKEIAEYRFRTEIILVSFRQLLA